MTRDTQREPFILAGLFILAWTIAVLLTRGEGW